jgi:predicted adenylyl cyclase CyaB
MRKSPGMYPVMYEIEIKILDIDRKKIEEHLISLGAKQVFDGEIHAVYYDSRDHSIKKSRNTVRLRREGAISVLTFKKHVEDGDAKVREEREVEVSDFDAMRSILESIGFSPWLEMHKHRTSYKLEGVHFEFDKYRNAYEYIPEFLEIEGTDLQTVLKFAEILGFKKQDCKPWDALQVAKYYSSETDV